MRFSLQNNTSDSNINVLYNSTQASNPSLFSNRTTQYSYGFNGMEKDDEAKGAGNSYDYGARIYDSRLGRWLGVDAMYMKYSFLSPYAGSANSPLIFIDNDGNDLIVAGSQAEFTKFKAVLEKKYAGAVIIERDKNNLVTMHFKDPAAAKRFMVDDNSSLMDAIVNDPTYKILNKLITNEKDTKVELVSGEKRKQVTIGSYRGGELNGKQQSIDMNDVAILEKSMVSSPLGAVIHELEEAFQDQVINNSPVAQIDPSTGAPTTFTGPHNIALESQKSVTTAQFDIVANISGPPDKNGISKIFMIGGKKDAAGNMQFITTTIDYNGKTGALSNVKNFNGSPVSADAAGNQSLSEANLGTEIK